MKLHTPVVLEILADNDLEILNDKPNLRQGILV
jgi:hypothetical protein